jgi:hypothetical protein
VDSCGSLDRLPRKGLVLGVALVGVAVYAVTIKTRLDYLEKDHDRQIHALWEHVNRLIKEKSGE